MFNEEIREKIEAVRNWTKSLEDDLRRSDFVELKERCIHADLIMIEELSKQAQNAVCKYLQENS